ncbi:hypothetical protein SORBI_3001G256300 [Sorghum bicolor]|uniref:Uncharacterized protein n=1 Tax=Sorghum bicolor TaxID=4558 RepID=A0A1Z5S7F9_SORBI|nr:hypothetical protein SORBI_3001G256300 [Sorghum bicolor]OQU91843.1 hypothetical protein SORBI_3001G256300 [Sorghum bicolor]OQU91844.1 hypothetical protein SORBI_3001G256300 [Sorghum bicolor]
MPPSCLSPPCPFLAYEQNVALSRRGRSVVQWNPSSNGSISPHGLGQPKHMKKTASSLPPDLLAPRPSCWSVPASTGSTSSISCGTREEAAYVQLGWFVDLSHLAAALSALTQAGVVDTVGNCELQRVHPTHQHTMKGCFFQDILHLLKKVIVLYTPGVPAPV